MKKKSRNLVDYGFDGYDLDDIDIWEEVNSLDDVKPELEKLKRNQDSEDLPRGQGGYPDGLLYSGILGKWVDARTGKVVE